MSKVQSDRIIDLAITLRSLGLPPYVVRDIIDLDRNRSRLGPAPSAYSDEAIVQTITPILHPLMRNENDEVVKRPFVPLAPNPDYLRKKRLIKRLIKDIIGNEYDYFILGAALTPLPFEEQPNLGVDIDINDLNQPTLSTTWAEPQALIGYENGKLVFRIEDYYDARVHDVIQYEVTPEQAADLIINLSTVYPIYDVFAHNISLD